jgi:iron complex transport system ATP-binding protein
MNSILKVSNLFGGYHKQAVIKGVCLDIKEGDFIGVIGPNGSGKSTLLRLMSRALVRQKGAITFEDKDIDRINLKEFCRKAAFVAQETLINFPFTVLEIALMGRIPFLKRLASESKNDFLLAENALLLTDTLHLKEKEISELSAGERQRVIIARALAQEPVLLFLDEPTSHLDIGHQIQILDLLRRLNREKKLTIVMVLHDLNLASEYCSRIILLSDGEVFKEGVAQEVLTYQNIEAVYKTVVVVNNNPLNSKPYVVLVSGVK